MFIRQKLLKHECTENVADIVFFIVYTAYFFGFIEAFDSKRMLNTLKKVLRQRWNALMLQVSLSLRDK